jgi:hypothetical protein
LIFEKLQNKLAVLETFQGHFTNKTVLFQVMFTCLAAGTSAQTAAQYALATLIATRSQISSSLPNYVTLQKRLDVLIQATQAALDPTCMKFLNFRFFKNVINDFFLNFSNDHDNARK